MFTSIYDDEDIVECLKPLILSERWSDVTFLVGTARLPAHRLILKARSQYFRALLDGGMRESNERELVLDVPSVEIARDLLTFIYTGCLNCETRSMEYMLDLMVVADKFNLPVFQHRIGEMLGFNIIVEHAFMILRTARLLSMQDLEKKCMHFIHSHSRTILKHAIFLTLSTEEIEDLVKHDAFLAPEVEILQGVLAWAENLPPSERQTQAERVLRHVRYSLITMAEALSLLQNTPYMLQLFLRIKKDDQKHPPRKNPYSVDHNGLGVLWKCASVDDIEIPEGAVVGGHDHGYVDLFVARALNEESFIPGKFSPKYHRCYVGKLGKELTMSSYEILCEPQESLLWRELPRDEYGDTYIPGNAVYGGGGSSDEDDVLFVGRALHLDTVTIGKIPMKLKKCLIPYGGNEIEKDEFEVLVVDEQSTLKQD